MQRKALLCCVAIVRGLDLGVAARPLVPPLCSCALRALRGAQSGDCLSALAAVHTMITELGSTDGFEAVRLDASAPPECRQNLGTNAANNSLCAAAPL